MLGIGPFQTNAAVVAFQQPGKCMTNVFYQFSQPCDSIVVTSVTFTI